MDKIISAHQNQDGSFNFQFLLSNGAGLSYHVDILVPPHSVTPYTFETAKAAALPLAAVKKNAWLEEIGAVSVLGNVTI